MSMLHSIACFAMMVSITCCVGSESLSVSSVLFAQGADQKHQLTSDVQADCMSVLAAYPKQWSEAVTKVLTFEGWEKPTSVTPSATLDLSKLTLGQALQAVLEYHGGALTVEGGKVFALGPHATLGHTSKRFASSAVLIAVLTGEAPQPVDEASYVGNLATALLESKVVEGLRITDADVDGKSVVITGQVHQIARLELLLELAVLEHSRSVITKSTPAKP